MPDQIANKTGQQITFAAASESHISEIRQLSDRIWHECYPSIISNEQIDYMLGWMYSDKTIRDEMKRGVVYVVAQSNKKSIGYFSYEFEKDTKAVKLHKIYLLAEYQGQGIGQRMLADVVAHALAMGAEKVYLTVNKGNKKAIETYQRAGFSITDSIVTDIGKGFEMNDYVFSKVF